VILPLRARLLAGLTIVALAAGAGAILLPRIERAIREAGQLARSPHGLAGSLAQRLLPAAPARLTPARHRVAPRHVTTPERRRSAPRARRKPPVRHATTVRRGVGSSVPWGAVIAALIGALALAPLGWLSRLWHRARRRYLSYAILPNGHDQPTPREVVAAVGTMGETVSEPASRRAWRGQPVFGLQLDYDPRHGGRVIPQLVCEPRQVRALDTALRQAYPNLRVGCEFKPPRSHLEPSSWRPPVVWRLRKSSDPIFALYDQLAEEELAPPLQAVATSLHGLGEGEEIPGGRQFAAVRVTVLPTRRTAAYLRDRHRRKERSDQLSQQIARGMNAPASAVDSQQARQSVQLSEHAVFHAEVQIAADSEDTCARLAGALLRYPGMNTLRRHYMGARSWLYRRRWAAFTPPLVMRGNGKVMTASELGYLMRLPTATLAAPITRAREPRRASGQNEVRGVERGAPLPAGAARGAREGPPADDEPPAPARSDAAELDGAPEPSPAGTALSSNGRPAAGRRPPVVIEEHD
jgi:hypothetical protein